ncbi:YbaB/EbfC DNA-binding family protein [Nonomuraea solani]|uniref:YbaB/EbfC DNA-binding family protein n=1 Tax=Nonomuraea solani TaxID=1144553 RepID=A0A1H6EQT7_9ACTN|nr:YbaB/EbfC family nucleoid-associated protein [Nonomuraea solani]SEG99441.1 YbaB/EbfC DNA-binding family protein [Nonomuraea solani]
MLDRELGALDLDKILKNADQHMRRAVEFQETLHKLKGRAEDEDGLVAAEYGSGGLQELTLHPKAMRLTSGELAERVKEVIAEAASDLQRQVSDAMAEAFGEENNPMRFGRGPEGTMEAVRQAESAYNRSHEDIMGELDKIRQRMEG